MKDANGTELKKDDVVQVVDGIEGFFNTGEYYTVEGFQEASNRIVVNPDARGMEGHYLARRVVKVNPEGQAVS